MTEINNIIDEDIKNIAIEDEMKKSYLDYAMSVIVSRALPDVRDGLKPVHRRILYAMKEGGYDSTKPYRKSARIVGDVMGKYHPHGDSAIYDSMVRMAQDFSLRLPLVSGQGNFGSMDGDKAAAMRYTEARLAKSAESLLIDIDKDTVDFQNNYDESTLEPVVLPAKFPNILVNGAGGIAIGMATNIPPHNLIEVVEACIAYINDKSISIEELIKIVPGPDFPTGGTIIGSKGRISALETGRGSVMIRSSIKKELIKEKEAIIITEIPYQVNKSKLVERIAEVVKESIVEGISDLRDESDRDGVRIVVEIKRDAVYEVVLNNLYRHTQLQTSFSSNMLAINNGRPEQLNLKDIVSAFIDFREDVVIKRTKFFLNKCRDRAHILAGLLVAINNIDPVIEMIKAAPDVSTAKENLINNSWEAESVKSFIDLIDDPDHMVVDGKYNLSEKQAKSILELRLQKLTGMEQDRLTEETEEITLKIKEYIEILSSYDVLRDLIISELVEVKESFGQPRKTEIIDQEFEYNLESLIKSEEMVVTVTNTGYIKRVPLTTYRSQKRGGKGRSGMKVKEDDYLTNIFVANTHDPILLFSDNGMCYSLKVYELPEGNINSKGKPLLNFIPLDKEEIITAIMPLPKDEEKWDEMFLIFATKNGNIRRNRLSDFSNIRANGKIAMKLDGKDSLVNVLPTLENEDVIIATKYGTAIRFAVDSCRVFTGRNSVGVRGIRLKENDEVVSMSLIVSSHEDSETRSKYLTASRIQNKIDAGNDISIEEQEKRNAFDDELFNKMRENESFILTVTSDGQGQLSSSYDYRTTNRGGKGINNIVFKADDSTVVSSIRIWPDEDEVIIVTHDGQLIRTPTSSIRFTSRGSKGVRLFNTEDHVVSVAHLHDIYSEDEDEDDMAEVEGVVDESQIS